MLRTGICLLFILMVTGCSTDIIGDPDKPISLITVIQEGKNNDNRPNMTTVCKGFYLTPGEVNDFYINASLVKETKDSNKYNILPCYARGTAAISGKLYNWTIRSGGVGIFSNENDYFVKICGINCCKKIPGIC